MNLPTLAPVLAFTPAAPVENPAFSAARRQAVSGTQLQVFTGSIDGSRRALLAAASRQEAIDLLNDAGFAIDVAHFRRFFCESANISERALAVAAHGAVFTRNEDFELANSYSAQSFAATGTR